MALNRRRRGPGELEHAILEVLWTAEGPLTPIQVQSALTDELAYNTVHTILSRLCDKGIVVRTSQDGRPAYAPATSASDDSAERMREILDQGADRREILARFVGALDPADEAALRAVLRRRKPRPEDDLSEASG